MPSPQPQQLRTGKLPARRDPRTLHYDDFLNARALAQELPPPPPEIKVPFHLYGWGMLGNDRYGDCVFAGAAHEVMLWTGEAGGLAANRMAEFNEDVVLKDYAAVTGFDPDKPSTDRGTVLLDGYRYRRGYGSLDAHGQRHQLGAYVELEPGNWEDIKTALYLGHAVGIGIEFPESAGEQFSQGKPWRTVAGSQIDGGHYVPVVGVVHKRILVVTWGKVQAMSLEFYRRYCDEAYALFSPEMLRHGQSTQGFDYDGLRAALQSLG